MSSSAGASRVESAPATWAITPTRRLAALAAITLAAAFLRFYRLGDWSFWGDEMFSVSGLADGFNFNLFRQSLALTLIRTAVGILGASEWSARLVSALIGVVSLPLLYPPFKRLFGVDVVNLGKQFRRFDPNRPSTLVEVIARGWGRLRPKDKFWALSEVDFSVEKGAMLGVIGHNGAGQSTLLRLLGGVGRPDTGQVRTDGRIGALLDLGTGFHPELTGRENVFTAAIIGGLTRREVLDRFDDIVAFAELEEAIDNPLRTYSTDMQMRLAVATHIDPEVLLIDEVLTVGDLAFQRECLDRIASFKARGCTIVLVSHNTDLVRNLCDHALWLHHGRVAAFGAAEVVVGQYVAALSAETRRRTPADQPVIKTPAGTEMRGNENRFGSMEMTIAAVRRRGEGGQEVDRQPGGALQQITIYFHAPQPIESLIFSVTVSREDGLICYDTSTAADGLPLPTIGGQGEITLILERLDLTAGRYFVDVGVFEKGWMYAYDYHWHVYPLIITETDPGQGILRPPHQWRMGQVLPLPPAGPDP